MFASICEEKRQHFSARAASPRSGAVVRDFKEHGFPMTEESWSVAVARGISILFLSSRKENQMIVTRERTSYGKPIASITNVASFALGPSDTNKT